jgi:hypothetical protein
MNGSRGKMKHSDNELTVPSCLTPTERGPLERPAENAGWPPDRGPDFPHLLTPRSSKVDRSSDAHRTPLLHFNADVIKHKALHIRGTDGRVTR